MKINSLLESQTPSSAVSNTTTSAPVFGRDEDKLEETMTSGCVSSVANPVGKVRSRGSIFSGINTSEKFPNSKEVEEATFNRGGHNPLKSKEDYLDKREHLHKQLNTPGLNKDDRDVIRQRLQDLESVARKQGLAESSLEEYGDTKKGQKMLTKVQKRAVDRMIKADDKRDAKNAKKNQDTANRAWDRMDDKDLEEGWKDTAKLLGVPAVAGALAVGAQHYDDQQPHVQIGDKSVRYIANPGWGRVPDDAMTLTGKDGKQYRVWKTSGKGGGHVWLAAPAEEVKEGAYTKTPSGDYINQHTGVRSSKPPVTKKKRNEKTGAEWDAIEKAKKNKEQGVAEGSLNEFAPPDSGDDRNYEYEVYQCNPNDQFDWIGGPIYKSDDMGKVHSIAYNLHKKHPDKAFMIWQERSQGSRGGYGIKDDEQGVAEEQVNEISPHDFDSDEDYYDAVRKSKQKYHDDDDFDMSDDDDFDPIDDESYYEKYVRTKRLEEEQVDENLRDWFKEKWVRFGPDGKIRGSCARGDDSEGKPKCLPQAKAHSLGKKGRASAAARKRREDPNPERSGKAINVNTKKKTNEEQIDELKCWTGYTRVKGVPAGAPGSCKKKTKEGVAEGHADQQRKIFKKNGKPVGEVGIDRESSPGVGQWYMKCYATGDDLSGYDSYEEAVAELKHCLKQGVAEGSLNEFAPSEDNRRIPEHYILEKDRYNLRSKWKKSYDPEGGGVLLFTTKEEALQAVDKFNRLDKNREFKYGGTQMSDIDEQGVAEEKCPHCGGAMFSEMIMNEKKDACYYKVKSRYKVWPSAYASGALVKCRKKGASNWGTGGKKNESMNEAEISEEMLAHELYKDLQIFKQGKDKTIGKKSKSKDISKKPEDRDIVVKEGTDMKLKEVIVEAANPAQQAAIAIAMKKKGQKPKNENAEYDDEAGMADNNLETLERAVQGIDELISSGDNLPEWCQEKIAVSKSMLVTVWDYMKSEEDRGALAEEFDLIESIVEGIAVRNNVNSEAIWEDLESLTDDELYVFAVTSEPINEDWQKVNKKDKTDGMSPKAVKAYRRENPGSKLKTAVTTKPSKLKKGSKASKRRKSYCSRSRGQMKMHNISCSKTPDKAICKARRRWNC